MSLSLPLSRSRVYQFWLRLWYASARTPRFKPLLRAEFANNDLLAQADFLYRAGYYNASVFMVRFCIEKRMKRLALISPRWQEFRSTTSSGMSMFLYATDVIDKATKDRFRKFNKKANKYVHETVVDKVTAARLLAEAENLQPILDAATCKALGRD